MNLLADMAADKSAFSTNFTGLDWGIVVVYLVLALLAGVYANRYISSIKAYVVGGGASRASLNTATYIGTSLGLVTLMYASMEGFNKGFAFMALPIINVFFCGILLGSTGLVVSKLRKMKLLTITEFFEKRYSRKVRIAAGVLCATAGILNMGLFPKMGATFITYATGLGTAADPTVMVNLITSLLIVIVLVYTVLGGMVSVIITDYVQFVILGIGLGLGILFCLSTPELGWSNIVETISTHRGEIMFNPVAEGGYGWSWVLLMCCIGLFGGFCWAPEASRALTAKDAGVSKKTFLFSVPGQFASRAIPAFWGITAFVLVMQTPALKEHFFPEGIGGAAANAAPAMPLVLGKIIPTGFLGILVAGLVAAFMSTNDSYLLCWASVISRDVVNPLKKGKLSGREEIKVTRRAVLGIGLFMLIWGIWYELPESVWNYMAVSGTIYLSGGGIALLGGCYWKRASTAGAWASLLTGSVSLLGLFLNPVNRLLGLEDSVQKITGPQVGLLTFVLCGIVFVVVSLLFPDREDSRREIVS